MKKTAALSALALSALALSGCATGPSPEEEVSQLALEAGAEQRETWDTEGDVTEVWEWTKGYAVLVEDRGENDNGPYSNWEAYWYQPSGDGWDLIDSNSVSEEYGLPDYPRRATCVALAPTASEREACLELDE